MGGGSVLREVCEVLRTVGETQEELVRMRQEMSTEFCYENVLEGSHLEDREEEGGGADGSWSGSLWYWQC